MKTPLLLLSSLLLCGCANITGSRVDPYGTTLKISAVRFLWATEKLAVTVTDTNGITFTLTAAKSNSDGATASMIAEGAAYGVAKAMVPTPAATTPATTAPTVK